MKQFLKQIIFLSLISFVLTSCTHKNVEVYQKEDELLNCAKLTTKVADLMDVNDNINKKTGFETNNIISWIFWPPIVIFNQANAFISRDKIDARFNYLMDLKRVNNCTTTHRETMFIYEKGRIVNQ